MKNLSSIMKLIMPIIILIVAFSYSKLIGAAVILVAALIWAYFNRYFYYYIRGNGFYKSGNMEQAFDYYEKTIKVKNCPSKMKTVYAYLLLKNRNLEKSEQLLNSLNLSKLNVPDRNQTRLNLALVYWKQGKLDKALELLETVYNEFKCLTMYESYGYLLILKGDYEKALKINLEAYEYDSSSQIIIDNLGETYYHLKDFDKSYELYKGLIDNEPSFPEAYYHFALVLIEKSENDQALEMLNKALGYKESFLSEVSHALINKKIEEIKQCF